MPRWMYAGAGAALLLVVIVALLRDPGLRHEARLALGLEPPPPLTPIAIGGMGSGPGPPRPESELTAPATPQPAESPAPAPSPRSPTTDSPARAASPSPPPPTLPGRASTPTPESSPTPEPSPTLAPSSTPEPVVVNGRAYDAYLPAAVKEGQAYQYSCEFDAAWVVLQTFGVDVEVDTIIARTPHDNTVEPAFSETADGFVIVGGDIRRAFSGDYRESFLARSSGAAMVPVFASFGLRATPVHDRAGVEAALRQGALVWMKTTVDFKPWRPATWVTPDGSRIQTVLGNDHAVVAIGFNQEVVVIRDVLGPTSTNRQRPLEYEVTWETFLWAWEAQAFDGLSVAAAGAP